MTSGSYTPNGWLKRGYKPMFCIENSEVEVFEYFPFFFPAENDDWLTAFVIDGKKLNLREVCEFTPCNTDEDKNNNSCIVKYFRNRLEK